MLAKLFQLFFSKPKLPTKNEKELAFWKSTINQLIQWYNGDLQLYGTNSPTDELKIDNHIEAYSAILTWHKLHQEPKYLSDLMLNSDSFQNLKVLDVGSGPIPSATVFRGATIYSLDHLMSDYMKVGYPFHLYNNAYFINAKSECIPFPDAYFDAIISVNAIDHVDNFDQTSLELKRLLKVNGLFRMHVHYHSKTICEPIEINDEVFLNSYSWVKDLYKLSESEFKYGSTAKSNEKYAIWTNF